VIIASGTRQQFLDIPGEKKFMTKGICYSALSYAGLFIDKKTLVIGNGVLALKAAAELAMCASEVNVVGPSKEMMESSYGRKLVGEDNVKIFHDHEVTEILGTEYADKAKIKSPDGEESILEYDGAFVEKALMPNTKFAKDLIEVDEQGRIIITNQNHTNVPGIFAAGDVTNTYAEQVLVAIGEGAKAALSACDYIFQIEN
jgi:alkyl hydroperoxide reductase subunit AhpF